MEHFSGTGSPEILPPHLVMADNVVAQVASSPEPIYSIALLWQNTWSLKQQGTPAELIVQFIDRVYLGLLLRASPHSPTVRFIGSSPQTTLDGIRSAQEAIAAYNAQGDNAQDERLRRAMSHPFLGPVIQQTLFARGLV